MGVPPGRDPRLSPLLFGVKGYQVQHSPDALGGAFGGIQGPASEKRTGIGTDRSVDHVGKISCGAVFRRIGDPGKEDLPKSITAQYQVTEE